MEKRRAQVQKPAVIYVADFDTRGGDWRITSRSKTPDEYKRLAQDTLANAIVKNLEAHVGPARRVGPARNVPKDGWLVTGRFTRVSEGNPAARIALGLGMGSSKLETETYVIDPSVSGAPFLKFATTGGSNAMPGAITSASATGVVLSSIDQAQRGLSDDSKRTARMITASIAETMVERGHMQDAPLKVKRPGQFQLLQPQQRTR